jgi:hypothetical protein
MTNIPIRTQILPNNSLASVQACIRDGKQVAGEDILFTIEQSIERQLPEAVQNIVRRAIIPAVKTRGRPSKFEASLDLALERVDQRYPALLRYEQRKKDRLLKSGKAPEEGESPSWLAPLNRGSLNSAHIHGTDVPVEEPSTASEADSRAAAITASASQW